MDFNIYTLGDIEYVWSAFNGIALIFSQYKGVREFMTTAAVLAQYRYQAGQAKLIHRLSDQFIAQTMLNLTDGKDNADFNKGIVKHEDRLTIVCLNDGSSFKFQEDEALP